LVGISDMGMSVSHAVRMLLVRVAAEKAVPFDESPERDHGEGNARRRQGQGKTLGLCWRAVQELAQKRIKDTAKLREAILLLIYKVDGEDLHLVLT
jgi:antitoxin component of RelBE/YafQ-DinJ toxin-antitoxin module